MAEHFIIRLDPSLRDAVEREAKTQGRTVPKQVDHVLRRWLNGLAMQRSKGQQQQSPHDALTVSLMKINGDQ
jgi:hypothetical protein